ncbi:MAG: tRNA (adenosine(37)-N6)-dimethylallyltransferase MiaA [Aggregatilineales bacterium]
MTGKPLIVITGATATGKTRLGIQLAQHFSGEIISADSRQVYRYMDIGTAKATPDEQAAALHHLIDIVEPDEQLSLAQYQDMAYAKIDALHESNKLPLFVGGTGQYITAVIDGWSIPRIPPNIPLRAELEAYAKEYSADALHDRLVKRDPEYAARTHPNNVRRVVRALEVCIESGSTMTLLQQHKAPPYRIYSIGLTMEREALYERVDSRIDDMVERGFIDEVQSLLAQGYPATLPAMSAVGYREISAYLKDEMTLEDAIYKTKTSTHAFIRRQDVWFRGHNQDIVWHNSPELDMDKLLRELTIHLQDSV